MSAISKLVRVGTHSGKFHCDDVLACVMLSKKFGDIEVIRTRDEKILSTCDIVVDVGGIFDHKLRRYDHHQRAFHETMNSLSSGLYPFDIKLSSCGLIYYFYGHEVITSFKSLPGDQLDLVFRLFYKNFVMPIDAIDNGVMVCDCGTNRYHIGTDLSSRVGHCNSPWYEEVTVVDLEQMDSFRRAMEIVRKEFEFTLNYYCVSIPKEFEIISHGFANRFALDDSGRIMLIEGGCPFVNVLGEVELNAGREGEILFVVFKNAHDLSYRVQAVSDGSPFNLRARLKEEFRGMSGDELEKACGIEGLRFVHSSGFMGSGATLEAVLALARRSIGQ